MTRYVGLWLGILIGGAILTSPAVAGPQYRLTDLGTFPIENGTFPFFYSLPHAINNAGQVVGVNGVPSGEPDLAFLWTSSGGIKSLGTLPGALNSVAYAINSAGQIVGGATSGYDDEPVGRPFLWTEDTGMVDLGVLPGMEGSYNSIAYDINDVGTIVGASGNRAFLWTAESGMQDLGVLPGELSSGARGINANEQVVGISGTSSFLWTAAGGMEPLGDLEGALAINDAGLVLGINAVWSPEDGVVHLSGLEGFDGTHAYGLNNSGQVVGFVVGSLGSTAFLWKQTEGMLDLNTLLDESANGWRIAMATAINDLGEIVAFALHDDGDGVGHAVLLTPVAVPEVSSLSLLMAAGLSLPLLRRHWRYRKPE